MQLEHSFTVAVGVDEAWRVLSDIGSISPCMPGSTIEDAGPDKVSGALKVKLGPLNLTYRGTVRLVEADAAAHRAVVDARGDDTRNGSASATVVATLTESDGSTTVALATDLDVTGKPAQFGRGVMADIGVKLVGQFAANLAKAIDKGTVGGAAADAAAGTTEPTKARPRPKPRKPTAPGTSAEPEEPAVSDQPAEAAVSDQPAEPAVSDQPAVSDESAASEQPAEPAVSDPSDRSADAVGEPVAEAVTEPEPEPVDDPGAERTTATTGPADEPAADSSDADAATFSTLTGLPRVDADAAPSVNGHAHPATSPRQQDAHSPGLAEAARPVVVKGLAPVALAVYFVLSAVRRRRGKGA